MFSQLMLASREGTLNWCLGKNRGKGELSEVTVSLHSQCSDWCVHLHIDYSLGNHNSCCKSQVR